MKSKIAEILENVVLVAIILVLVQTFMEDFSVLFGWSWNARVALILLGFIFDLFFTIEFLVRTYISTSKGRFVEYFNYERGWLDFLASVPLLILNSGPSTFAVLTGGIAIVGVGGMLNILKVIKAIRIARILRLLRVLKIVKQIKNTDSVMAQRHVAKITGISVNVFVFSLLAISLLQSFLTLPSVEYDVYSQNVKLIEYIKETGATENSAKAELQRIAKMDDDLLIVKKAGVTLYSKYEEEYYKTYYGASDYGYYKDENVEFFFDLRSINADNSKTNMAYFLIIIVMVIVYMVYYSPHFAITISDPIHVMRRGFNEKGYNLEVIVPGRYKDDDIFQLAEQFNEVYLPMKDRQVAEDDTAGLELKMDDMKDLFEGDLE